MQNHETLLKTKPDHDNSVILACILTYLKANPGVNIEKLIKDISLDTHPRGQERLEHAINDGLVSYDDKFNSLQLRVYGQRIEPKFRIHLPLP